LLSISHKDFKNRLQAKAYIAHEKKLFITGTCDNCESQVTQYMVMITRLSKMTHQDQFAILCKFAYYCKL